MNIINIEHISKVFGGKTVFEDASCGVQEGDKIGIVGINGTGKTTLLGLVAGLETPDEGQVVTRSGIRMAYLSQTPEFGPDDTVASYAFAGDPDTDWKVQSNLNELGITDWEARIDTLSGGQKKRAAMAKILADSFDVLLLDEPTNHLDQEMTDWLEEYLCSFRGTVLMVTHDRYFLDRVTGRILEIDDGKIYSYEGDYSTFLELKAQREERELAAERKRKSVLRMELEWAKRGCRARSTKQRARLERLEALSQLLEPFGLAQKVRLDFSLVNSMDYYNGIIFQGFVPGVPSAVLSGGRYDKLPEKMGKRVGAIGFGIDLSVLEQNAKNQTPYDVDYVLNYDETARPQALFALAKELREEGYSVLYQPKTAACAPVRCKKMMDYRAGMTAQEVVA